MGQLTHTDYTKAQAAWSPAKMAHSSRPLATVVTMRPDL